MVKWGIIFRGEGPAPPEAGGFKNDKTYQIQFPDK